MIERPGSIYLEGTGEASEWSKRLLAALRSHRGLAVTSELTLAEVLAPVIRPDALAPAVKRRAYLDLLTESKFIELTAISRAILLDTVSLRMATRMKLADAIHLASAMHAGSELIVSRDRDFRRLPDHMSWIVPDEQGVTRILREIA